MNYKGVIIEESLENKDVLKDVTILSTKVEEVTAEHHTPYLKQWTLHTVEIPEDRGEEIAQKLVKFLKPVTATGMRISKTISFTILFSETKFLK